uniref:Activin_recp domain-containing protein n=1 Tax=Ascaris lumbricoides TaxID=6252 RepID=A0A0M3IJS0_ASCLU
MSLAMECQQIFRGCGCEITGSRRREGYLRGCMSDILHYNQTIARLSSSNFCAVVRMRDLFVSTERYLFEPSDHVQLCTCHTGLCNSAIQHISIHFLLFLILFSAVL